MHGPHRSGHELSRPASSAEPGLHPPTTWRETLTSRRVRARSLRPMAASVAYNAELMSRDHGSRRDPRRLL